MKKRMDEIAKDPNSKEWGLFFAWDPELINDLPTLSADFLDENFSSTIPMLVMGQSGHVAWANHPALEMPDPVVITLCYSVGISLW